MSDCSRRKRCLMKKKLLLMLSLVLVCSLLSACTMPDIPFLNKDDETSDAPQDTGGGEPIAEGPGGSVISGGEYHIGDVVLASDRVVTDETRTSDQIVFLIDTQQVDSYTCEVEGPVTLQVYVHYTDGAEAMGTTDFTVLGKQYEVPTPIVEAFNTNQWHSFMDPTETNIIAGMVNSTGMDVTMNGMFGYNEKFWNIVPYEATAYQQTFSDEVTETAVSMFVLALMYQSDMESEAWVDFTDAIGGTGEGGEGGEGDIEPPEGPTLEVNTEDGLDAFSYDPIVKANIERLFTNLVASIYDGAVITGYGAESEITLTEKWASVKSFDTGDNIEIFLGWTFDFNGSTYILECRSDPSFLMGVVEDMLMSGIMGGVEGEDATTPTLEMTGDKFVPDDLKTYDKCLEIMTFARVSDEVINASSLVPLKTSWVSTVTNCDVAVPNTAGLFDRDFFIGDPAILKTVEQTPIGEGEVAVDPETGEPVDPGTGEIVDNGNTRVNGYHQKTYPDYYKMEVGSSYVSKWVNQYDPEEVPFGMLIIDNVLVGYKGYEHEGDEDPEVVSGGGDTGLAGVQKPKDKGRTLSIGSKKFRVGDTDNGDYGDRLIISDNSSASEVILTLDGIDYSIKSCSQEALDQYIATCMYNTATFDGRSYQISPNTTYLGEIGYITKYTITYNKNGATKMADYMVSVPVDNLFLIITYSGSNVGDTTVGMDTIVGNIITEIK